MWGKQGTTTRPAALTGTIGQGGFNRVHDVALVQALLGAKRDRSSRPYLRDHVTGGYDQAPLEPRASTLILRGREEKRAMLDAFGFDRTDPLPREPNR